MLSMETIFEDEKITIHKEFSLTNVFYSYTLHDDMPRIRADSFDSRGTPSSLSADEQDLSPMDQLPR